jgi:hypothetical protein
VSRAWYPLRTFPLTVASAVWTPRRWFSFLAPSQSAEPDRWFTESPLGHERVLYDDHHVPDGEHDHHRRHERQCHPGHREPGRTTLTEVGTVTGVAKTQGHLTVRAVTSKPIDEVTVLIQDAVTAGAVGRRAGADRSEGRTDADRHAGAQVDAGSDRDAGPEADRRREVSDVVHRDSAGRPRCRWSHLGFPV